jgi:hypothetical protein
MCAFRNTSTCAKRVKSVIIVLKREGKKGGKEGEGKRIECNDGKKVEGMLKI